MPGEVKKVYEDYYLSQIGRGMPVFRGVRYQRGHGLGNVLRNLTKFALPFLKKGLKAVGKQAVRTGMNIAQEAMQGQNIKAATKRHLSQGLTDLVTQRGRGRSRKRGPPGERIKGKVHSRIKKTRKKTLKRGYKRKATLPLTLISSSAKHRKTSKKDIFG